MEQRRGRQLGLEVVGRLEGEAQVGGVERSGDPVGRDVTGTQRREDQDARGDGHQDEQGHGRQQPAQAAGVEGRQRDRPGRLELAEQQAADQEARQDEEDVDPDVSPAEARDRRVVEQDQYDRDGTEAFDVRAEAFPLDGAGARGEGPGHPADRATRGPSARRSIRAR